MNLEEFAELRRKKKPRRLFDIEIEEITLCASPAIRKKFFITKMEDSMKDFNEALDLVASFLDDNIEKEEIDMGKIKEAMHVIAEHKDDIPDKLKSAISIILKWAGSYGSPTKKSETDNFPSIPIMVPSATLEKMIEDDDDKEDEDDDEWG